MNIDIKPFIEKFNSLDIKARYAVFGACLLVVVGLDYALLIRLQLGGLAALDAQIQTVSTDISHVKTDIQRINQIKAGLETSRTQLQTVSSKIRSLQEVPMILEDISRTANEFHVDIDQLSPSKESQEVLVTGPDAKYYSLPIVITARSGYHMFGHFLNKLESANLLFMVEDLRVEDSGKGPNNLVIQATLKMVLADRTPEAVAGAVGK